MPIQTIDVDTRRKGAFIVLYGINNIGKSTQAHKLVERLQNDGYEAEYIKYPKYDVEPSGPIINEVLRGDAEASVYELQLWYVLNRHQFQKMLLEKLNKGIVVVSEDYIGTGIAWGMVQGAEKEWLVSMNQHLYIEDLAIYMQGERFLSGKEDGHMNEDNHELMLACSDVHDELAEDFSWRAVEAAQSIDDVHSDIYSIVLPFIEKRK